MNKNKEYQMKMDPRILELLGPNLYTNIYYVLGEIIANSYDADAKNVYIIQNDDAIRIEDDGKGMSYEAEEVAKFLDVAKESRTNKEEELTKSGRKKMGRKGVGKLAALSVSDDVYVMTKSDNDVSAFILTTKIGDDGKLEAVPESQIVFDQINDIEHGTAIVMNNPRYKLHKTIPTVKKNLIKIFSNVISKDFKIHLIMNDKHETMSEDGFEIFSDLVTLITVGDKFSKDDESKNYFDGHKLVKTDKKYTKKEVKKEIVIEIENKEGQIVSKTMEIEGWIGTFKSTVGTKKDISEFAANHISLFAHGKMGQFNILENIGKNTVAESYVVGQFHIDLFEDSDLPDMALSNRQGYLSDDIRYIETQKYIRALLQDIINLRTKYSNDNNKKKKKKKAEKRKKADEQLFISAKESKNKIEDIVEKYNITEIDKEEIINNIDSAIDVKKEVNINEEPKILISQTGRDKRVSEVIYQLLLFNGFDRREIIYTNSDTHESHVPYGMEIYPYLKEFFVENYSKKKLYVIYVTSQNLKKSWGATMEVGAGWIVGIGHDIFNINDFQPEQPLDNLREYGQFMFDEEDETVKVRSQHVCVIARNIHEISRKVSENPGSVKSIEENEMKLKELIAEVV